MEVANMTNLTADSQTTRLYVTALEARILKLKRSNRFLSVALGIAVFFDVIALLLH
jgi:hypothetical protein